MDDRTIETLSQVVAKKILQELIEDLDPQYLGAAVEAELPGLDVHLRERIETAVEKKFAGKVETYFYTEDDYEIEEKS